MKSRKQVCIAVLCLLSAVAVALAFTSRTSNVQAGRHSGSAKRTALAQPATYLANSLRAAFGSNATLLNSVGAPQVMANLNANPMLPDAEEFSLTPPDSAQKDDKTTLSVRFAEADAEKLAAQIPMTLAGQSVVLQRSGEDPSVFSTHVDFDWTAFLKMQQHRKQLARQGKTIPIYKGRDFIRREIVQFVEPADIHLALQKHQAIQFKPEVLLGNMLTVVPDHELMIVDKSVVEDTENGSGRTYDACLQNLGQNPGNPNGAWTFQTLWMAATNAPNVAEAEQQLDDFFFNWVNSSLTINGFIVMPRNNPPNFGMGTLASPGGAGTGFLANWPVDTAHMCTENSVQTYCPLLFPTAGNPGPPMRLNAIVNRIDLAGQPGQYPAGELRFVFGATAGVGSEGACFSQGTPPSAPPFNVIFEYHVPNSYTMASQWATQWDMLPKTGFNGYAALLEQLITDNVVEKNSCTNNTCLFHIRTNEILLADNPGTGTAIWELREFGVQIVPGSHNIIREIAVDQTPDNSFNFGGSPCLRPGQLPDGQPPCNTNDADALADWINPNQNAIYNSQGVLPLIPQMLVSDYNSHNQSFQGGSSVSGFKPGAGTAGTYWNNCASREIDGASCQEGFSGTNVFEARRYFSLNTCNGCHGEETSTSGMFQQVFNRLPTNQSNLSNFLLGCSPDNRQSDCATGIGGDSCSIGTSTVCEPGQVCQCQLNTPGQEDVEDLVDHNINAYGDIVARQTKMSMLAPVNEIFLPFMRPHIGVH